MATLLTRDEARANELNEDLSKTIFGNAEGFIQAYSDGWLSRTDKNIQSIAQKIVSIYQNVQLKGRDIVFVSQTEVMINEAIEELAPWKHLTKIKRALSDIYGDNEGTVYLSTEHTGYVLKQDEDGEYVKVVSERFFRSEDEVKRLYKKHSSFYAQNPNPAQASAAVATKASEDEDYNPMLDEEEENYSTESEETVNETTGTALYEFKVSDFTTIDDSFIEDIYDLLVSSR